MDKLEINWLEIKICGGTIIILVAIVIIALSVLFYAVTKIEQDVTQHKYEMKSEEQDNE